MDFRPDEVKLFTLEDFSPEVIEESPQEEDGESPQEPPASEEETGELPRTRNPLDKAAGFTTADFLVGKISELDGRTPEEAELARENEKIEKSEQFNSQEFTIENSLLTNAENYANTIRDGARIYSERMHAEADATHEKAKKTLAEAEAIKRAAEEEKQELLEAAQTQVQSIKDAAYQEGFAQGEEAGTQQRYQDLAPQVQKIDELIEQLSRLRQIVRFQGEQELLQLALLIAKKVVCEELTINPEVLYNITRTSLQEIDALGKIRILINPGDYEFMVNAQTQLEKYIKDEQTLVIQANIDAQPGEILIETDETIVDFHFQKQFEAIEEVLSRRLEERQTQLHGIDMDAHDFDPPSEGFPEEERSDESLESPLDLSLPNGIPSPPNSLEEPVSPEEEDAEPSEELVDDQDADTGQTDSLEEPDNPDFPEESSDPSFPIEEDDPSET